MGGSVEGFAVLMNAKAKSLGLKNSSFVTPHGLDHEEHYTTAYELAVITDYALNIPKFAQIVNTKTYTVTINGYPKQIANTNELLGYLNGVNGVKTGFTNNAGRCLVTSVTRNDWQIICVVLGADTKKIRTTDSIKLIEYCYANYKLINIDEKIQEEFTNWKQTQEGKISVNKGVRQKVNSYLEHYNYTFIPIKKEDEKNITVEIDAIGKLEAPVSKDVVVGSLRVKTKTDILASLQILNREEIEKKQVVHYFFDLLKNYNQYIQCRI